MFSTGQLIFGLLFFIAFVIAMFFAYKKDAQLHQLFYKGNYKILVGLKQVVGRKKTCGQTSLLFC